MASPKQKGSYLERENKHRVEKREITKGESEGVGGGG